MDVPDTFDVNEEVRGYIAAIAPEHRPLFDRVHRLVLRLHPEATVLLSYKMPTYRVGTRRLYVGVWKHGLSLYGWQQGKETAFSAKHPEAKTSKGTIRLRPQDSVGVSDDELSWLVRAALDD